MEPEPASPNHDGHSEFTIPPIHLLSSDRTESSNIDSPPEGGEPLQLANPQLSPTHSQIPWRDNNRVFRRYKISVRKLEKSLKHRRHDWESFHVPPLDCDSDRISFSGLRAAVDALLDARSKSFTTQSHYRKVRRVIDKAFAILAPAIKNLLQMAKDGANVHPDLYSTHNEDPALESIWLTIWGTSVVDDGLLSTNRLSNTQIAEREIARRKDIEQQLDYISHQLGQLEIIERLPISGVKTDPLFNRAVDVLTAIYEYLAVHIRHESGRFGFIGIEPSNFTLNQQEIWRQSLSGPLKHASTSVKTCIPES